MSQAARPATKTLAALGLVAVVTLVTDCYKPSVESGGLFCATTGKPCPDGFTCTGGLCVSSTPDASSSTGGHGGSLASGGRVGSGGQIATGGGGQVGSGGAPGSGGASQLQAVGQACIIMNRGAANQSDNCEADAVCSGYCPQTTCFRTCTSDADCPESTCSRATASGTKICELAYTPCDPHAQDNQQGCDTSTSCYLLSDKPAPNGGDQTVCDCEHGEGAVGDSCVDSRDCFPRLVCPPTGLPGGGACRAVCDPTNLGLVTCGLGSCHLFGSQWGYCY